MGEKVLRDLYRTGTVVLDVYIKRSPKLTIYVVSTFHFIIKQHATSLLNLGRFFNRNHGDLGSVRCQGIPFSRVGLNKTCARISRFHHEEK
jgi:hypothetical protein